MGFSQVFIGCPSVMIGIVCAHPDDEILGMGATIAKHRANNDEVSVLYMGEGREGGRQIEGAASAAALLGFSYELLRMCSEWDDEGNPILETYHSFTLGILIMHISISFKVN